MTYKRTGLDNHIVGISLMIIFTSFWTILAEYFFDNSDFRVVGITLGFVVLYLIYSFVKFNKRKTNLTEITSENKPKINKWFYTISAFQGIAIFVVYNILVNIDQLNLIICCIALIVGIHFVLLAKVFDRKFDYYIGSWTTIIAIIGFVLIVKSQYDYRIVNAFVCLGCALSTTMYGIKIIIGGNSYLKGFKSKI